MVVMTFDKKSNALYITLHKRKIAKTLAATNDIFVDVDNSNVAVGIEVLFPKTYGKKLTEIIKHSKSIELLQ